MSRARMAASLALIILMIAAPILTIVAPIGSLVAEALQAGTTIKVYPYKIVQGQDVLFTVVQTAGAFTPGATLYFKLSNANSWGTGAGDAWIGLPPGQSVIPTGSTLYITGAWTGGLSAGTAYLLLSDSTDGSTGVTGAEITVETGVPTPYVYVYGYYLDPSDIITVSYSPTNLPSYTVSQQAPEASPGDTIYLLYYVPGNTVYFYWDYYGGQLLATASGGYGIVSITIPDAPEGYHKIVAVSDTGYGAFNFIYVTPTLIPDKFSIEGKAGERITFTGRGFPANAELDTNVYVVLTVSDGLNSGIMNARIISGGVADALGRMTFTIELLDNKPPTVTGGLVDVTVTYKPGFDIDNILGAFQQGELGPSGDGTDTRKEVLAISTPIAYGDELLVVRGLTLNTPDTMNVGDYLKVAVINFPANTKVDIYIGYKLAGSLVTDSKGAALGWIKIPELPGSDNSGIPITYEIQARAVDPATGGTLVGIGAGGGKYLIQIGYKVSVDWTDEGYGTKGDYLVSGLNKITVKITGLSPFAKVTIEEVMTITGYGSLTVNVAEAPYSSFYQPITKRGSMGNGYFMADAMGVLEVEYTVSYLDVMAYKKIFAGATGDTVDVYVAATTASGANIITSQSFKQYKIILAGYGDILQVLSSPASITPALETIGTAPYIFKVVHPGDYIEVQFSNLVPGAKYRVLLNGGSVQIYDTSNKPISYFTADSTGAATIRFTVPNSPAVIGLNEVDVVYYDGPLAGQVAGGFSFIASSPRADIYGPGKVIVYPSVASPGDMISVIGVNFESGETLKGGFSTIGTTATDNANQHGAVLFMITVPSVPAGTYTVYIQRTVTYETFTTTIEIVPEVVSIASSSVLATLYKSSGDTVSVTIKGLDANRAYMVYWSDTPEDLGAPLTDTGIPGYGTPLTWFSDTSGTLAITFTVPFGVVGEAYYASIVPADDPTTRAVEPIEIIILPGANFDYEELPYLIAGEEFTVIYKGVPTGLTFPASVSTVSDQLAFLTSVGTVEAVLTMPDGTIDTVPATMEPVDLDATVPGYDALRISFKVPNADASGVVGLTFKFQLTYIDLLKNTTSTAPSEYIPVYVTSTSEQVFGGVKIVEGGGIALASIEGSMATLVTTVNDAVTVITQTVSDLEPMIEEIQDGIAYLNTTLGVVKADVGELKEMLGSVNATVVAKGDEVIGVLDTKFGEVQASLDALVQLVYDGFAQVIDNQVVIQGALGDISMSLSDLQALVGAVGDNVVATLSDVNASLANLIIMKGDEVVATLSMLIEDLKPVITGLNESIATLQTIVGEVQVSLDELLGGQAEIKQLIVNESGAVQALIETKAGELNATLGAALEMLSEGLATASQQVIDELVSLRDQVASSSADLANRIDQALAAIGDVRSLLSGVSSRVDAISSEVASVSSKVDALSSKVDTVSSDVDSLTSKVDDVASKVVQIQSDLADVKTTVSDVKSGVNALPGSISSAASDVKSAVQSSVGDLSDKVDDVSAEVAAVKSRVTLLGGLTAVLVVVTLVIAAIAAFRRPE